MDETNESSHGKENIKKSMYTKERNTGEMGTGTAGRASIEACSDENQRTKPIVARGRYAVKRKPENTCPSADHSLRDIIW